MCAAKPHTLIMRFFHNFRIETKSYFDGVLLEQKSLSHCADPFGTDYCLRRVGGYSIVDVAAGSGKGNDD